jgi:hypothetical protein
MMKPGTAIAIGILLGLLGLTAATPSSAQSPPETSDYFQGDPSSLFLDSKACADGGRSTVGAGDIVEPADQTLVDKVATMGSMVCPPPDIDPDVRSPVLSNPGHWGHRPN